MSRIVPFALLLLAAGCDSAEPAEPIPYAEADQKPVAVGGWEAFAARVEYPQFAERARIEGDVAVQFVVTAGGADAGAGVLTSPNDLLSEAAIKAVRGSAYVPGREAGVAVPVRTTLCLAFRLEAPITAAPCMP